MRVTLVAETFSPAVNGVVNSVIRVAGALAARGHEPVVVAPSGEPFRTRDGHLVDVVRVPAIGVPGYRGLRVARPGVDLRPVLRELRPDVVHLASPAVLGWSAVRAAAELDIASVAVFQTDLSGFLRRYHLRALTPALWSSLRRLHNSADLTLVPSSTTGYHLRRHGVSTLELWARGVDGTLFHPARRDERLRAEFTGGELGATVVGFVGRLAAEKRVAALAPLTRLPGVRVVVVGDGPRRRALEKLMPDARFLGLRTGTDLGRIVASLDRRRSAPACRWSRRPRAARSISSGTARTAGCGPAATRPCSPRRWRRSGPTALLWRRRASGPGRPSSGGPGTPWPTSSSSITPGCSPPADPVHRSWH